MTPQATAIAPAPIVQTNYSNFIVDRPQTTSYTQGCSLQERHKNYLYVPVADIYILTVVHQSIEITFPLYPIFFNLDTNQLHQFSLEEAACESAYKRQHATST